MFLSTANSDGLPQGALRIDAARDRVARGVALLNAIAPGWRERVTRRPIMNSMIVCILAQVFGDYDRGISVLRLDTRDEYHATQGASCGFTLEHSEMYWVAGRALSIRNWEVLEAAWMEVLANEN